MPKKRAKTTKKTKIVGKESYINPNTGELVEMDVIQTNEKDVDMNFHKLFLADFLHALDIVSNQKTKIAYWVIENLNKDNQLVYSYRQIADKTGISYQTVANTIAILKDADFLRQDGRILIVNPDIIFKGTAQKRLNVLHKYQEAETGDRTIDNQIRIANLEKTIEKLIKQKESLEKLAESSAEITKISEPTEQGETA